MTFHTRPALAPARPSPEIADELRRLKALLQERRDALAEREPPEREEIDAAREESRRLQRFAHFLLSQVEELRAERDELRARLEDRERIDELHAKFLDLAAFAEKLYAERREDKTKAAEPPAPAREEAPIERAPDREPGDWPGMAAARELASMRGPGGPRAARAPSNHSFHRALRRA